MPFGQNAGGQSRGAGRPSSGRASAARKSDGAGRKSGSQRRTAPDAAASDGARPDADPYATARSIVLRQLTLAPKSRHQLASKLAEREVSEEVAGAVLDRFEEVQLIDDAEFAMMWVRSRSSTRSLARSALKRELAEKGIHGDIAEEALAQVTDDEERAAAEQLVLRKHRPGSVGGDRAARDKETRRLVGMLGRKGYSPSLAFGVVKSVLDDAAEPLSDVDGDPDFG